MPSRSRYMSISLSCDDEYIKINKEQKKWEISYPNLPIGHFFGALGLSGPK